MKLLIAEDEPVTRRLLERTLLGWDYDLVVCEDGTSAWDQIRCDDSIRIALLDWNMPPFDGIELCRRISTRKNSALLYTIVLTQREGKEDHIGALAAGAHDFISKPFDKEVLRARLEVAGRIVRHEAALEDVSQVMDRYASHMEQLAQERTKQLVHADRMSTLGVMAAGIAHEINNPMSFISGNVQILERFWRDLQPLLENGASDDADVSTRIEVIRDEIPKIFAGMRNGVQRVTKIVKGLKTYSGKGSGERDLCNLNTCIEQSLEIAHGQLKAHVTVDKQLDPDLPQTLVDAQQIEQVLINLFVNAAHAMQPQGSGILWIESSATGKDVVVKVRDSGPGIPQDKLDEIWKPFFTTKEVGKGTGLGLAISHTIIGEHGGKVTVDNHPDGGAQFVIQLPIRGAE